MAQTSIPRPEYPRPQMVRENWVNLNGEWDFSFDFSKSGMDKKFYENGEYNQKIVVPFCPESKLSGIEFKDFIPAVWYRKEITISNEQLNGITLIHFGAVDYFCRLFVNGKEAGTHKGGYASFSFDIAKFLVEGTNTLVLYAEDDVRSGKQPRGKQCGNFYSSGCDYTRTTGIWQTVWLEFVSTTYVKGFKVVPDLNNSAINMSVKLMGDTCGVAVSAKAFFNGNLVGETEVQANGKLGTLRLNLSEKHVWEIENPNLYDLEVSLTKDGHVVDKVTSYFGLRSIELKNNAIYLNDKPVFQRLVLDQGFYPDGVYTAPSDADLIKDIELSQSVGYNGARLHEKAFEERFLYHADRMGYLVWGEHANWGLNHAEISNIANFLPEWIELVERDFNHPSLIGWCPFNETWDINGCKQDDEILRLTYLATKAIDPTRPVIDTSGNYHVVTDIYDVHDYEQNVEKFEKNYLHLKKGEAYETHGHRQKFGGQPYFVSEYGGTWWNPKASANEKSWGYGNAPKTEEEVCDRYVGLTDALVRSEGVCAFCYTQLYDVEQEQNGLFTYNREKKFSDETYKRIRESNAQKAAIEK